MSKTRFIKPCVLSDEQLNALSSQRLLALYKIQRGLMYSIYATITYGGDVPERVGWDISDPDIELYQQMKFDCTRIKNILDSKEHVERKPRKKRGRK